MHRLFPVALVIQVTLLLLMMLLMTLLVMLLWTLIRLVLISVGWISAITVWLL
jgi:hypothetical protein